MRGLGTATAGWPHTTPLNQAHFMFQLQQNSRLISAGPWKILPSHVYQRVTWASQLQAALLSFSRAVACEMRFGEPGANAVAIAALL